MNYTKFSAKQAQTLTWWNDPQTAKYDAIICDGSIRSGKTISMAVGFVLWSMCRFDRQNFAICGKTIQSLRRNVVSFLPTWLEGLLTSRKSFRKTASSYPPASAATSIICSAVKMKAARR